MPALLYATVLVFFLGFEIFGLPLVLGDPEGHLVLATYLYKLTNKLGTPSYHLMAAVAVCIVAITFPLVLLQRWLLKTAGKFVSVKGKATRQKLLPLGGWKWVALAIVALWLAFTIVVPISGHHAARVRRAMGRGHQARRRADARQLPAGVRPVRPGARDRQHVPHRHAGRRAGGRLLHGDRPRRSPAARRCCQGARLPGAHPARDPGAARRPRLPLDLPVRAGAEGPAQHDLFGVAGVRGRLARVWPAPDLRRAAADRAGARGVGAHGRRVAVRAC